MPNRATLAAFAGLAALAIAGGCANPLQPRVDAEKAKVSEAKDRFSKIRKEIEGDLRDQPDLFRAANVNGAWRERLQKDEESLNDAGADLARLLHHGKPSLFNDVTRLRESALTDVTAMQAEANQWLDLKRDPAKHVAALKADFDRIRQADLSSTIATLEKAKTDWPAKKTDLEFRVGQLKSLASDAEPLIKSAQTAADAKDYAGLMAAERKLHTLAALPDQDRVLAGQLYQSWDKVLKDLDDPKSPGSPYREHVRTITTKYVDLAAKQTSTTNDDQWIDIPESTFATLKSDVGMTIEHKPAGAYDSEVDHVPQPPGFGYIAPPGQQNQYGYWEQRNGNSFWTWFPQYLVMRELLWNHHYVPVPSYEYNGYWQAHRTGTVYYGGGPSTPSAPAEPKYGTHGTFTAKSYADSRYRQQAGSYKSSQYQSGGGYRSSGYANPGVASPSTAPRPGDPGHQFGRAPNSQQSPSQAPSQSPGFGGSGKRFGTPGGGPAPRRAPAPAGRRYGRR